MTADPDRCDCDVYDTDERPELKCEGCAATGDQPCEGACRCQWCEAGR